MPGGPGLHGVGLCAERGGRRLWGPLTLTLAPGQALWLRGPNGCGKTTLLRSLAGLHRPLAGQVQHPPGGCWWVGHSVPLADALGAAQNLRLWMAMANASVSPQAIDAHLSQQGVPLHRALRQLSAGQRRRVALAPLCLEPRGLWLLDEPLDALDDAGCQALALAVQAHRRRGGILVFSAHQSLPPGWGDCDELHLGQAQPALEALSA